MRKQIYHFTFQPGTCFNQLKRRSLPIRIWADKHLSRSTICINGGVRSFANIGFHFFFEFSGNIPNVFMDQFILLWVASQIVFTPKPYVEVVLNTSA